MSDPIPAVRPAAAPTITPAEERKLRATARDVESIFLQHLLKTMRQASGSGSGLLSGTGQRVYQELVDEQLSRSLAKSGGLGLADMLVRDVLRRQGVTKTPSSAPAPEPMNRPGGLQ